MATKIDLPRRAPRCALSLAVAASVAAWLLIAAPVAGATSGEEVISAGTEEFINATPANLVFPGTTLSGVNQTATKEQAFDVKDARGSAVGWSITATSTTFASGTIEMSTTATEIKSAPTVACDASSTCTTAVTTVTYPYALPAAKIAPAATKMFNAKESTGLGDQTVTPTWSLAIPSNSRAGTYTSTWTFTLGAAP